MAEKPKTEKPEAPKQQLLAVEHHPILGRTEHWQLADGSVKVVRLSPEFVEK